MRRTWVPYLFPEPWLKHGTWKFKLMVKIQQAWATNRFTYPLLQVVVWRVLHQAIAVPETQSRQKFWLWYWWYNVDCNSESETGSRIASQYIISFSRSDKRSNCCSKAREYRQKLLCLVSKIQQHYHQDILNVVATIFKLRRCRNSARLVLSSDSVPSDLRWKIFALPPTSDHQLL